MTQHIANASDADLLQQIAARSRGFFAKALVKLTRHGREDVLRGVVRIVIDVRPFEMIAFIDEEAIDSARADDGLGPIVATIFERGLRTLSEKWQRTVADLIAAGRAHARLVLVLGQDKPHIDGVLTTDTGDHHQLFTFTTADPSAIVH